MRKLIVANWKSYLNHKETIELTHKLCEINFSNCDLTICPSIAYAMEVRNILNVKDKISLGAQDVASRDLEAFTGGVNSKQLSEIGVKYTIVGHSERRIFVHETAQEIHDKIMHLVNISIIPILCVGEDSISHKAEKTQEVISMQLDEIGFNIDWSKVIVAYEPIWAIGSGQTPSCIEIEKVIDLIKQKVNPKGILYGGSVSKTNIVELTSIKVIDGFLIGSASIKLSEMIEILAGV